MPIFERFKRQVPRLFPEIGELVEGDNVHGTRTIGPLVHFVLCAFECITGGREERVRPVGVLATVTVPAGLAVEDHETSIVVNRGVGLDASRKGEGPIKLLVGGAFVNVVGEAANVFARVGEHGEGEANRTRLVTVCKAAINAHPPGDFVHAVDEAKGVPALVVAGFENAQSCGVHDLLLSRWRRLR